MPFVRVTQGIVIQRVLSDLSYQTRRLLDLQRQLSTGQKVNAPSDDPLATRRAIAAQSEIAGNQQYISNISNIGPFLSDSETALRTVHSFLQRANELTIQGLNDTNTQQHRNEIANEVNQIIEGVLSQANAISGGRYVFGGTRTLAEPFDATRDANGEVTTVAYAGNSEKLGVEISKGVVLSINVTGEEAFSSTSPATVDVIQTLIDIRDNLRSSDTAALEINLAALENAEDQTLIAVTRIGAVQRRIEDVTSNLDEVNIQLQEVISDNIDADFAEVVVNLNAQTNAYQAALNAAARVIQPSLLDFVG